FQGCRRPAAGLGRGQDRFLAAPAISPGPDEDGCPDSSRVAECHIETNQALSRAVAGAETADRRSCHEETVATDGSVRLQPDQIAHSKFQIPNSKFLKAQSSASASAPASAF